ncbi:hypothetical protein GCWU000341_00473 [Oribacterium sp. oral taxon 078 str. F0262]|nr:hypothetical protein GCWU000341_00473 [Oribacterium sp. oral taxon 078 str. F0262]
MDQRIRGGLFMRRKAPSRRQSSEAAAARRGQYFTVLSEDPT